MSAPVKSQTRPDNAVPALPAWLVEAKTHLRTHYPHDGLAESVLWALYVRGFDPDRGQQ